ncbi:MAG TPA: patatin-like phospholipase family protein [Pyrinomonadaceae bacterium]|jgi:hypothetical protein|nr:patatin-like phospholipase family protein [Pyrinomonadaceae bacterium]
MSTDSIPLSPANSQTASRPDPKVAVKAEVKPPSPRLRLWQVLREEYLLFHEEPPALVLEDDFWQLKEEQLVYPQIALFIGQQGNEVSRSLFNALDDATRDELKKFDGRQHLSSERRAAILKTLNDLLEKGDIQRLSSQEAVADVSSESEPDVEYNEIKLKFPDYKRQLVNRWLLEESFPEGIVSIDESLTAKYYQAIHPKEHAALCLSGGGIRSATFNLGLLQGLARHGLLENFDYLSTVSGGGFSGGWLSAWIKRHPDGLEGVMRELGKGEDPETTPAPNPAPTPTRPPQPRRTPKPLEPEPKAFSWLRSYSNFLSPKLGLFSADTWTLVATLLRNIFLNWLVFVPVLMAVLMLPRLWVAFVARGRFGWANSFLYVVVGFIAGMIALLYIGLHLPSTRKNNRGQGAFLRRCLVPVIISAIALATYGMRAAELNIALPFRDFWIYQVAIIFVPWVVCAVYQSRIRGKTTKPSSLFGHFALATILILIVQTITAWLMWRLATTWEDMNAAPGIVIFYACFAVPIILGLLSFTGLLLAGLTSNYTEDEDQEWWARTGAWVFITMIGWSAISVLVLYGPQLLIELPRRLAQGNIFSKEVLATVGGIVSGVIAIYGGFSSKAPATDQEAKKSGFAGMLVQLLINVAAAVFLVFIIIVLALLTNLLLVSLFYGPWLAGAGTTPGSYLHSFIIQHSPAWLLVVMTLILAILGVVFGRLINTNKFSLHYLWRNRIIRAYLGASNPNRQPNLFTGFDQNDNIQMHELKPTGEKRKLLHVLNFALNLVGGEKLAWQERKAESFTASPLHCGNYLLGYRRAESYGRRLKSGDDKKKQGISLGTSIAISGAFVSPNMGYMQTSPVIRFLMTLFNVRFGWWLGNSGRAGGGKSAKLRTYDLDSPRLSVIPIVEEALGMTNDKSDYIYLSDGGHFENFGLYEMVLRRCRLIVIGDATSDAEYSFESLGQSLRKIRIDFGIPIEFTKFSITKPSLDEKGVYAAIGTIGYHCIDGTAQSQDGTVILIKPTLIGNEARDILNYATQSGSFPQEFIGDQWFSESQFESYRALGSHIVDALCRKSGMPINDRETLNLNQLKERLQENLNPIPSPDKGF